MDRNSNAGASLELSHITKKFQIMSETSSLQTVLDDITFSLSSGSCTLIGGANGSGKSVLMSIISGLVKPTSGTVRLVCNDKRADAGLVFQDADAQILGETPLEDVLFGLFNIGLKKQEAEQIAHKSLASVGLEEKALYPARFLSGGEKRRLAAAGIIAMNRPLVIFDEPYANLDYTGIRQVNALISLLKKEGRTIIILTHELEKSLALCSRFIILYHGRKVFDGTPEQGIQLPLEQWDIHNPLTTYTSVGDLVWR